MNKPDFTLSAQTWQQVQDLLADALEHPPDVRTAFLRRACGHNLALYREVESLLSAYTEADTFLDTLDTAGAAALLEEAEHTIIGSIQGPYRIGRTLGRGGMGVVYLAEDTRLGRSVALKFLPPHLAANEGATQRLFAEARAAATLDHPHIAVVHEIGETADGRPFIAMAYYAGETLQEKIRRGPLPVEEAVRLARQIAAGLQAAHRQGIVHQDIKPSNILITPTGTAKIVDFGIARIQGAEQTKTGAMLGTVAYMSPEQTHGEAVDARTDLWALGVVLYEMLTGRRPFQGQTDQAHLHAIRHDAPEPVAHLRPDLPAALVRVVERCLQKPLGLRYPDAGALLADLEPLETGQVNKRPARRPVWRGAAVLLAVVLLAALYFGLRPGTEDAPAPPIHRLAVLPFDAVNPEEADAYLATGMSDELAAGLSKLHTLRVLGPASVRPLTRTDKSIAEIGQALDVSALLKGSVSRTGNTVKLTLHLLDPQREVPLWTAAYDAEMKDLPALQRRMAGQVAEALQVQVLDEDQRRLAKQGTAHAEAYERYLKGRHYLDKWEVDYVNQARDQFQAALDIDPTFANAWAGLADTYKVLDYLAVLSPAEAAPRTRAAAERALALDPDLAEAHAALAVVLTDYYYDWETAGTHFQRAVALDPSSGVSHQGYAEYLRDLGRFDEALAEIDQAQALNPLSPFYQLIEGIILYMARRPEEAMAQYERILSINPDFRMAHFYIGMTHALQGAYAPALAEMEKADPQRTFPDAVMMRGYILATMGRTAEARKGLEELDALAKTRYISPFHKAVLYQSLGEPERALALLEQAAEERSWFVRLLKVAPHFDALHTHPRFQALLAKIGLDP